MDLAGHALVLVDLQRRIVELETWPRPAAEVVGNAAVLAKAFRKAGLLVVLVRTVDLDRPEQHGDQFVPEIMTDQADDV